MTDMSPKLFLIAHKVRGKRAFDVAVRCEEMGTLTDPGPWWIIPTSGHRAYPYWSYNLDYATAYLNAPELPPDLLDHYPPEVPRAAKRPSPPTLNDVLGLLP